MDKLLVSFLLLFLLGLGGLGGGIRILDSVMSSLPSVNNTVATTQASPLPTSSSQPTVTPYVATNTLSLPIFDPLNLSNINQNLWLVVKDAGNIGSVVPASTGTKISAGNTGSLSYGGLMTKLPVKGNFETIVGINNFTSSGGYDGVARISVEKATGNTPNFSNDSIVFEIYKKGASYALLAIHYVNDIPVDQAEISYPNPYVMFKIDRNGADFVTYYTQNGSYQPLKEFKNVFSDDSYIFIGVKSSGTNPSVSADFFNFELL